MRRISQDQTKIHRIQTESGGNTVHYLHKTRTGRVVYNRPRHFFSLTDVKRILKNILEKEGPYYANWPQYLSDWLSVEQMLFELLLTSPGGVVNQSVLDFVKVLLSHVFDVDFILLDFLGGYTSGKVNESV